MLYCKDCANLSGNMCVRYSLPVSPVTGKTMGSSALRQRLGYGDFEYEKPPETVDEMRDRAELASKWFYYGEVVGLCGLEAKYFEEKEFEEPIEEAQEI